MAARAAAAGSDPRGGADVRKKLEEALGKLDISEEEATHLGALPFVPSLRAPDEFRKQSSSENTFKESKSGAHSKPTTRNSSTNKDNGEEVVSPDKNKQPPKRKEAPTQVHRPVANTLLLTNGGPRADGDDSSMLKEDATTGSNDSEGEGFTRTICMTPLSRPSDTNIEKVGDLIDTTDWSWRQELVRETFTASYAEAILNIPLRQGGGDDFLAWAFERSGNYSVKMAYRALVTQNKHLSLEEGTATETSYEDKQLRTALWKLDVIPKVRVFWWRVLRGILPDDATLNFRHIAGTQQCRVCSAPEEDLKHALIHCPHAQRFWEEACAWFGLRLPNLHPVSWARDITRDPSFTTDERARITTIMWSIWHSKNRIKHGDEGRDPAAKMKATKRLLHYFIFLARMQCGFQVLGGGHLIRELYKSLRSS
ncbi:Alanyl-tRNA synthetase [Hordeum vulgare]|nr:Alanyl-tRNA synthetase [Hordeum vulgare]